MLKHSLFSDCLFDGLLLGMALGQPNSSNWLILNEDCHADGPALSLSGEIRIQTGYVPIDRENVLAQSLFRSVDEMHS